MGDIDADPETHRALTEFAADEQRTVTRVAARAISMAYERQKRAIALARVRQLRTPPPRELVDASPVGTVHLDDETHAMVSFAAEVSGLSESEILASAVRRYAELRGHDADPWSPVDVYAQYDGQRVEGQYLPATRRLTVTTGPITGAAFSSPSAAARAVVNALKPDRADTPTNGWKFWRLVDTNERLDVLRQRAPKTSR
ncbi:MAG TPA: hypothetical protein VNA20_10750 [Frankiaceae bacterium]|nr:hypothetical protein [Frankiaceae bacterium]